MSYITLNDNLMISMPDITSGVSDTSVVSVAVVSHFSHQLDCNINKTRVSIIIVYSVTLSDCSPSGVQPRLCTVEGGACLLHVARSSSKVGALIELCIRNT